MCRKLITYFILFLAGLSPARADSLKLPDGKALLAEFVHERVTSASNKKIQSSGNIVLVPDTVILWQIERPQNIRTTISFGQVRQVVEGVEVNNIPIAMAGNLGSLTNLFEAALNGDWSLLQEAYQVRDLDQQSGWKKQVMPFPNSGSHQFTKIIFSGYEFVDQIQIVRDNGGKDDIRFFDHRLMATADALTKFDLQTR